MEMRSVIKRMNGINILFRIGSVIVLLFLSFKIAVAAEPNQAPVVKNVQFRVEHGQIVVNYDLAGDNTATYKVSLILKKGSDSTYQYIPNEVTGDVGIGKFAGVARRITWIISKELPGGLPGADYYFVVKVQQIEEKRGISLLTMIGAGAAVIAAATTYFVVNGIHSQGSENNSGLPAPPGRP